MDGWIAKFHLMTAAIFFLGGLAMVLGGVIKFFGHSPLFGGDPVTVLVFIAIFPLELIMLKWLIVDDPFRVEW